MNKTGLKTFVFSFAITLSAILVADRAFLHPSQTAKEPLKIPRKNITLFFSQSHLAVTPSQIEPVLENTLETPEVKPAKTDDIKIAGNLPPPPPKVETVVREELPLKKENTIQEEVEIPELIEDKPLMDSPYSYVSAEPEVKEMVAEQVSEASDGVSDIPLVYAGVEEKAQSLGYAQKEVVEKAPVVTEKDETLSEPIPLWQPKIITGTRQIVKIDNLKKKQERQKSKEKPEVSLTVAEVDDDFIPLQGGQRVAEEKPATGLISPPDNQIAALGEVEPLVVAEEKVAEPEPEAREWQTMAEKHHDESPWVVARGSKFIKNKKMLEAEFASDKAKENAERLLSNKSTVEDKSVKVAVHDNLLIPIPQDILDEDDLVPTLGTDKSKQKPLGKKQEAEPKSFLDNIASVFSKENREKAIKNLKEKSNKLVNASKGKDKEMKPQILPTEIRLSFQPNRAEISGQTLRWIQAFARKAADDDSVGLEIRIDGTRSFELQQKRLNLLYNILTANDVPYQKLNTVFSDREPNSFVVRTVKITNKPEKKEDDSWKKYYQKW